MLFNSINFGLFFLIVFVLYWFVTNHKLKLQNLFLLIASYFFYACWDWRLLFLLAFISLLSFFLGLLIQNSVKERRRKFWKIVGIVINIGVLSYFKYTNFFIDSFLDLFSSLGFTLPKPTLNIILPFGISYYIFFALSYIIDIYQGKLKASTGIMDVMLCLSFFPIILAGPIQRPLLLLPQITNKRTFNYYFATDGLRRILWGLFMKVVIADKCAIYVTEIFNNYNEYNGSTLLLGAIFFTIQIYSDFAGYSLIAIGISKLLGFELVRNFAFPYFSQDISQFWKRWHMSLTSWFRDYVFLPIAYKVSRMIKSQNVFGISTDIIIYTIGISITWFFTGLWHGGNFTFIIWGIFNGIFLIIYQVFKKPRMRMIKRLNINKHNLYIASIERLITVTLIILLWVLFRSDSLHTFFGYLSGLFSMSIFEIPNLQKDFSIISTIILSIVCFIIEWIGRNDDYAIARIGYKLPKVVRWAGYYIILLLILFSAGKEQNFIYFQF